MVSAGEIKPELAPMLERCGMSSRHHDIAQSTLARSRWQRDIAHGERAWHDGVRLGLGRLFDLLDKLCDELRQRFMFDIAGKISSCGT